MGRANGALPQLEEWLAVFDSRASQAQVCQGNSEPPNGSRLSCGRNARGRKETDPQTKRLASEATQFFLTGERPSASSAC
jgi:hypothetical protein